MSSIGEKLGSDVVEQIEKFKDFVDQNYREEINQIVLKGKRFLLIDLVQNR